MENKNWQLASTLIFFLNIRKWKMKIYVHFFFSEMWKPMFDFHFFSGHRKMKKTKQNKAKKRKCVSTFNFLRKMRNNKSVVNFQLSMKTNSTHNVFLLFFIFVRCPDPLLLELNKLVTIESLLDRGGERGYYVIRD